MKLKKGDTVVVIAGKDKGSEGEIIRVMPKDNKVIVTGVNIAKRHAKQRNQRDKAGIIDKDMPMDASNVMFVHKGKPTRLGYKVDADGTKHRVARRTGLNHRCPFQPLPIASQGPPRPVHGPYGWAPPVRQGSVR